MCEAGGVDSLWQTDRMVSREPFLECMSVMAALAGRTRRLKFGVNVLSLAFRDAVLLAQAMRDDRCAVRRAAVAGVRHRQPARRRNGGRLNLDTKTRGRKTDEGLEIIRRLWREDKVDFEGVHYHLSGASICPKPVQPDLPMWIGGSSEAAIRRTARFGTGWQAGPRNARRRREPSSRRSAQAAIAEGRAIDDDHYGAGIPFRFGRADDPASQPLFDAYRKRTGRDPLDYFAIGDAEAIVDKIAAYVDGRRLEIHPAPGRPRGDDEIMAQTRRLIDEVLPLVAARWPKQQSGWRRNERPQLARHPRLRLRRLRHLVRCRLGGAALRRCAGR